MAKRLASVDRGRCVACGACESVCPRSAITIWKGCYAVIDNNLCVGCGKCANICPATSIEVKERVDEKANEVV